MERKNIYKALQFSLTTFTIGAFLFMTTIAVILPLTFSNRGIEILKQINWFIFFLELFLLTASFSLITINLIDKVELVKWRGFLAGILAVILLAIFAAFSQGASLSLIIALTLIAGMSSVISLLIGNKKPMQ